MTTLPGSTLCCFIVLLASEACAQVRIRPRVPLQMKIEGSSKGDPGNKVQMLESPNIDRFLRKAQDFLGRGDFVGAINILQDVIEGRTLEEVGEDVPGNHPEPEPNESEAIAQGAEWLKEDPKNAVFSNNDRLYRPVRRLCHELLATLPAEGMALYRSIYEVQAERALTAAGETAQPYELEEIYNRYFGTLTAAKAMARAGDRLMDQGKFRAAIQTLRLLLDVYPGEGRVQAGISDSYLKLKTALCFRKLGDGAIAAEFLAALRDQNPSGSVRIMGNLVSVTELGSSELFGLASSVGSINPESGILALNGLGEMLVPLWEYRFEDPVPYQQASSSSRNRNSRGAFVVRGVSGQGLTAAPRVRDYVPGTSVHFIGDQVALMDHFRPRLAELISGRLSAEGDGPLKPQRVIRGQPRARVPAYDFSSLRIADDGQRVFVIIGNDGKAAKGMQAVTENHLAAYSLPDLDPSWSSESWPEYQGLTFLATPTVFNKRLLAPVAYGQTLGLQCLDARNGKPIFRVQVHRGGTQMARPPASPITVAGGIAYVLTNAGAIAAVDAYTGSLRWIRKYERVHPLRERPRRKSSRNRPQLFFGGQVFAEIALPGFAPSELIASNGLVIFAPSDGEVLHCLDGASGEPVWMLSKRNIQYLIGHNEDYLFAGGKNSVYCIGLRSGLRLWKEELDSFTGSDSWRGRGLVTDDLLIIPGNRELLLRSLSAPTGLWTNLPLPGFLFGRKPLSGPFNVQMSGPYLALSYQAGVELYSTFDALTTLADSNTDPLVRATYMAQAGELLDAIETLERNNAESSDPETQTAQADRILSYGRELALAMATHGARDEALRMLERCREPLSNPQQLRLWHLARLEVFQALGDTEAYSLEQAALYQSMGERRQK